jgi:hypothetical protein
MGFQHYNNSFNFSFDLPHKYIIMTSIKAIITGATGMVGEGVLLSVCKIQQIRSIVLTTIIQSGKN